MTKRLLSINMLRPFMGLMLLAGFSQFCCATPVLAQSPSAIPAQYSPRTVAVSTADIADTRDEWAPNPAQPADTSPHIWAVLAPLPLGISDTWSAGFSGDYPLSNGAIAGASFSAYQTADIYSFESFGLQASKTFDIGADADTSSKRKAVAGVRLRYSQETSNPIYLPFEDFTADLGAEFDIAPQLTLGAVVTHLFGIENQDIPIESRAGWLGLAYRPVTEAEANIAIESSAGSSQAVLHAGVEYWLDEYVAIRVGTETVTGIISGGIGVRTDNLTADFAAARHPDLGTSISFGIGLGL